MSHGIIVNVLSTEAFTAEDGLRYIRQTKEILTPRKTFVKGDISGKYRGDRLSLAEERRNLALFDFEIYEAQVVCASRQNFRKDRPFRLKGKIAFPREKLPRDIPVSLSANGACYEVNILEPSLFNFQSLRRYRQIHGDEVYGTFTALISGYILDYEREVTEQVFGYAESGPDEEVFPKPVPPVPPIVVSPGERRGLYLKTNRSDGSSAWRLDRSGTALPQTGCAGGIFGFVGVILGVFFLAVLIPNFFWVLLIAASLYLIYRLAPILKWIFRAIAFGVGLLFAIGIASVLLNGSAKRSAAKPVTDDREVVQPVVPDAASNDPVEVSEETKPVNDIWIKRFRAWEDYDGDAYEGYYAIRRSDFDNAHRHKNDLSLAGASVNTYDKMIYSLKEYDEHALGGLYKMFDSIQESKRLPQQKFAEMVVSMVQDIPYALVLEQDCRASLYRDAFISQWLSKPDGYCDPYQRFGINTPVEFLTNLKGDCDTRTLLLYTILSHYGYDVVLLSSEVYRHSIIGINLPLDGTAYTRHNVRYVVWETTARGARPGVLSSDAANMNHWRISLKSNLP